MNRLLRGLTRLPWISGAFCRKSAGSPVCPRSPGTGSTILLLFASLFALTTLSAQEPPPDPIFQAMRDEIARALTLSLPNL